MSDAPLVELRLPSVLKVMVGRDRLQVRGRTLADVLESACGELSQLRYHLTLESGDLRPHVLWIVNEQSVPREEWATTEVSEGDAVQIHQAISGG